MGVGSSGGAVGSGGSSISGVAPFTADESTVSLPGPGAPSTPSDGGVEHAAATDKTNTSKRTAGVDLHASAPNRDIVRLLSIARASRSRDGTHTVYQDRSVSSS
jgi:hypothetical protein